MDAMTNSIVREFEMKQAGARDAFDHPTRAVEVRERYGNHEETA